MSTDDPFDDWVTAAQAAQIISRNSGKAVSADYIRRLVAWKKLSPKILSPHVRLYRRAEVEQLRVKERGGSRTQEHVLRPVKRGPYKKQERKQPLP